MTRFIEGNVNKLCCRRCECISHSFTYSGDIDMVPVGLVGLSSRLTDEIVLFEVPESEWGNNSNVIAAKDRLSNLLGRNDFVYVEFRGLETSDTKGTRTILSKCPVCEVGVAACIQVMTIAEYENNGGSILFLDDLKT